MKFVTSMLLATACAAVPPKAHQLDGYSFQSFLVDYGKTYPTSEWAMRKELFVSSLQQVRQHNAADHTWTMGINKFSDMTAAEVQTFKGKAGAQFGPTEEPPAGFMESLKPVSELPASVDWREKGVVTPTKDQGGCGSCWAFSATEVYESHIAIETGKLLELSPQELVSCAPNPLDCGGTGGCQGSVQWLGFNYSIAAGGLSLESSYPYTARTGSCQSSAVKPAAGIKGYVRLPANDYTALMNAVATIGPIAISVDASWGGYEGGVFNGACGPSIDHAVVLVGYGTDAKGGDYYLVRNSWGGSWGEDGYIKIARKVTDSSNCATDKNPADGTACKPYPATQEVCGLCGILSDSSYPTGGFLI